MAISFGCWSSTGPFLSGRAQLARGDIGVATAWWALALVPWATLVVAAYVAHVRSDWRTRIAVGSVVAETGIAVVTITVLLASMEL
jgi:hypothetical protein